MERVAQPPGSGTFVGAQARVLHDRGPQASRFGRSLFHLCHLFDLFDGDGIALVFLDIGLDTTTSQGRLLRNVMAAFAEYESDLKSEYSRESPAHGSSWATQCGQCPYGYRYNCSVCAFADEHGWWGQDDAHCSDCHRSWSGHSEAHCAGCCRHFTSDNVFDRHFDRHFDRNGDCLDPATIPRKDGTPSLVSIERKHGPTWMLSDNRPHFALRRDGQAGDQEEAGLRES